MKVPLDKDLLALCKEKIDQADGLLITAGAGMGVDSGLPDFRGNEGFWQAYPKFKHLGLSFMDLANPRWFYDKPSQAWGFYGHRYNLYKNTPPHPGFDSLRRWCDEKALGGFVFTSNVDGHFLTAGFVEDQLLECHGTINHLQCLERCRDHIWPAQALELSINEQELLAEGQLPTCPDCGGIARPNILMFGDMGWNPHRTDLQYRRYHRWLERVTSPVASKKHLVVLEFGAGVAVPTVRHESESVEAQLIRINPRDTATPQGGIVLECGALEAIEQLDCL